METQTVDVTDLNKSDKVSLIGRVFTVEAIERNIGFALDLNEVGGVNFMELFDIEAGTTFEKVVPDPEEFRVRGINVPESFVEFLSTGPRSVSISVTDFTGNEVFQSIFDKADLKAVVEKL